VVRYSEGPPLKPRFHLSPAVAFPPAVKWITSASIMGQCGDSGDTAHSWVSLSCQMKSNRERLGASPMPTLRPGVAPCHPRGARHQQQENHCKAPAQSSSSSLAPADAVPAAPAATGSTHQWPGHIASRSIRSPNPSTNACAAPPSKIIARLAHGACCSRLFATTDALEAQLARTAARSRGLLALLDVGPAVDRTVEIDGGGSGVVGGGQECHAQQGDEEQGEAEKGHHGWEAGKGAKDGSAPMSCACGKGEGE